MMTDKDLTVEELAMIHGRSVEMCSADTFDTLCDMARRFATEKERADWLEEENQRLGSAGADLHDQASREIDKAYKLSKALTTAAAQVEQLREALEFYADPETYFAIAILPDPPCGDFWEDQSDTGDPYGWRHGKRAREALSDLHSTNTEKSDA